MRFTGLALCLLASSLGARAESLEDRIGTLEQRIKDLEQTLLVQSGETKVAAATPVEASRIAKELAH